MLPPFARYGTAVVALAVLVIGLIFALDSGERTSFRPVGFWRGAVPTYVLAKTLFGRTTLLVAGQLMAEVVQLGRNRDRVG